MAVVTDPATESSLNVAPERPISDTPPGLTKLKKWLVVLLAACAITDVIAIVAEAGQLSLLNRLTAGEDLSIETVEASDAFAGTSTGLQFLAYIVAAVVWVIWFRRAYSHIPRLTSQPLRFKAGWAIGGWFVPIMAFYRPKQIANDIWRATDVTADHAQPLKERPVGALLNWWWAAWIAAQMTDNAAGRVLFTAETLDAQTNSTYILIGADVLSIIAAGFAIVVVKTITQRYEAQRILVERPATNGTPIPAAPVLTNPA